MPCFFLGGASGSSVSVFVPFLDDDIGFAFAFAFGAGAGGVDDALAPPSCGCVTGGNATGLIGDILGWVVCYFLASF